VLLVCGICLIVAGIVIALTLGSNSRSLPAGGSGSHLTIVMTSGSDTTGWIVAVAGLITALGGLLTAFAALRSSRRAVASINEHDRPEAEA